MSTKQHSVEFATLAPILKSQFGLTEKLLVDWVASNNKLSEIADSLDVVEFGLVLEETVGVDFAKDDMDSITLDSHYKDLASLVTKYNDIKVNSTVPKQVDPSNLHMYAINQSIKHVASGREYLVIELPESHKRLEDCNEPYYRYVGSDGIEWSRRVSQMEDGRFTSM